MVNARIRFFKRIHFRIKLGPTTNKLILTVYMLLCWRKSARNGENAF